MELSACQSWSVMPLVMVPIENDCAPYMATLEYNIEFE